MVGSAHFNFVKYRFWTGGCFFALLLGAGVVGYVMNGGFKYSVDFTGGTQVLFKFSQPVGSEELKGALARNGWDDAVLREFSPTDVLVRVQEFAPDVAAFSVQLQQVLQKEMPNVTATIEEANVVGPATGATLRMNALIAFLLGLIIMLVYIAFRFWSVPYGVGAIVALVHDAIAILAVFALLQREISPNLICAILATLGYSINDTIVIFARIRENFAKNKNQSPAEVVNEAIHQTLRRTILTSLATTLVVLALLIFGGEALRNLSLALLVGIVVGTYSSIFIASPIMLALRKA